MRRPEDRVYGVLDLVLALEQTKVARSGPVRRPVAHRVARVIGPAVLFLADALGEDAEGEVMGRG